MNEKATRLQAFHAAATELERNRLLHRWLANADEQASFYAELRDAGFPVLRFASLQKGLWTEGAPDPAHIYLVTGFDAVSQALMNGSVSPYAELDSGGRFMLGIDNRRAHDVQQKRAMHALRFNKHEITTAAKEAIRLATILPLKNHEFDLVRLARWAAVHYVALLFGMPQEELGVLDRALWAIYRRLSFQIVGRHFVPEIDGAPAVTAEEREKARKELEETIERLASDPPPPKKRRDGTPAKTVIEGLGYDADLFHVAMGLMAGTVGNVVAAISDSIHHLIATPAGRPSFGAARQAAWTGPDGDLEAFIELALVAHPPAPFLARRVRNGLDLSWPDANANGQTLPPDATLLLALGADARYATELRFGGAANDLAYPHRCIGQHLAMPLVIEAVRAVLRLPGLDRVYDTDTGRPRPLEKTWGAVCERFPLQFQRDRLMNQQPLHVVLPIKPPVARNAAILARLTEAGAPIVEDALRRSGHVHFAWFNIVNGGTHLAMCTVYDGDFDAYVEHFALKVPLFDKQFEYLDVEMPRPIAEHPKRFTEVIRSHQLKPVAGYFFSAYPHLGTSQIAGPAGVQP
jgi:cytochrome P450